VIPKVLLHPPQPICRHVLFPLTTIHQVKQAVKRGSAFHPFTTPAGLGLTSTHCRH
jgi:hypothetical protein